MEEITKKSLSNWIKETVKENEPFDNEYDFQFNLALKLRDSGYKVKFEKFIYDKDEYPKCRCDLVLCKSDNPKILIELKYIFTGKQAQKTSINARESFVKDYNRILNKIESRNTVKKGFVVFLTNKKAVFKQTKSSSNKEFVQKFHELVNKDNKNNHKWQDCEFKDNQECKLLVVEVKDKLK